jgi:hypothetical protein
MIANFFRSLSDLNSDLQRRIAELQQADRHYWRGIIADLRQPRGSGNLMPEGNPI